MFGWGKRRSRNAEKQGRAAGQDGEPPIAREDVLLAETVARLFDGASVDGRTVQLGFGGIEVGCHVQRIMEMGAAGHAAALLLRFSGGVLGPEPVFASITGYEKSPRAAVVSGGCLWACAFGEVLRAGVTGEAPDAAAPDAAAPDGPKEIQQYEMTIDGRRFLVTVDGADRAIVAGTEDPVQRIRSARERLGGRPWLIPGVIASQELPLLTAQGPTLLSLFVAETDAGMTHEVKVNGTDWGPLSGPRPAPSRLEPGAAVLLREFAVLTPLEPPPPALDRGALQRTLSALATRLEPGQVAGWQGWSVHRGQLAPVLSAADVEQLEAATGVLPADYVRFLTETSGPGGAGPGYGLLRPQRVRDVVPLAHAGCGVAWLLRLDREHYGEVWVDSEVIDDRVSMVAGSFAEWYAQWLDGAVRDQSLFAQWDVGRCATASVVAQVRDAVQKQRGYLPDDLSGFIDAGGIAQANGGAWLDRGAALDPCHGCVELVSRYGLAPDVFAPGVLTSPVHR